MLLPSCYSMKFNHLWESAFVSMLIVRTSNKRSYKIKQSTCNVVQNKTLCRLKIYKIIYHAIFESHLDWTLKNVSFAKPNFTRKSRVGRSGIKIIFPGCSTCFAANIMFLTVFKTYLRTRPIKYFLHWQRRKSFRIEWFQTGSLRWQQTIILYA